MCLSRRDALKLLVQGAGLATLPVWAWGRERSPFRPHVKGCCLSHGQLNAFGNAIGQLSAVGDELIASSGNRQLDVSLGRALVRMSQIFGEQPGFAFVDDSGAPNAYASSETRVPGTWGTVLFGLEMFRSLFRLYDDGGMAILLVMAHEFGHIAQFRSGLQRRLLSNEPTVRRVELHADFLGGYYLGLRKRQHPNLTVWSAGDLLRSIGDYAFDDLNHHGTPDQRVAAAEAGFALGQEGQAYNEAFTQGAHYVLTRY